MSVGQQECVGRRNTYRDRDTELRKICERYFMTGTATGNNKLQATTAIELTICNTVKTITESYYRGTEESFNTAL